MSFSQFIKDYINSINNFYDSFHGHINPTFLLKFFLFYIKQSTQFLAQYILNFRFVNDFYYFKVAIPQLINSNFNNLYFSGKSLPILLNFFDSPFLKPNLFIIGLFNSLILSAPFSSSQILWLRWLTVEGIPAGIASGLGIISSQLLLNICILFGFRFVILSWHSFESINYVLGAILTLCIVYAIAHKPINRIKISNTDKLVKIFLLHFALTWVEHTIVFQYLSNLSFNAEPTLFETLSLVNDNLSIINYLFGLLFGIFFWTVFFGWVILSMGYSASKFFNFPYSKWVRTFHNSCLVFIISLTLTSFPYYSLDYLITAPLGFISQDDALKVIQPRVNSVDLKKGRLGEYSSHSTLDTDVSVFDRGRYQTGSEIELSFEDLNYQGEYIWRSRNDRLSSGSAGLVSKIISKFLPRLRNFQKRASINLKLEQAKRKLSKNPFFKNQGLELSKKNSLKNTLLNNQNLEFSKENLLKDILLNDKDSENSTEDPPSFLDADDFIKRFLEDYQADVNHSPLPEPYHEADKDPYSAFSELARYGFDSFAVFEEVESNDFEEKLGKRIRYKYYLNYVYRFLLNIDLLDFLKRQPKNYSLTKEEENDLFQKRLILGSYYDTLREYSKIPNSEYFDDLFMGPKSYANRIYNNQFKGTIKIIRRIFSISLEDKYNQSNENVLKFDQPLYKKKLNNQNLILHEELKTNPRLFKNRIQRPFLKEINSIPFYAGWDVKLRKFIVTNYWLNYSDASAKFNYPRTFGIPSLNKRSSIINFITWPLSKQKIEKLKKKPRQPFILIFSEFDDPKNEQQRDIFEYAEPEDYDIRLIYEALPSILKRVDLRDKEKGLIRLEPLRGGIIWPGNEPAKLKTKGILKLIAKLKRGWRDSNP